MERENDCGCVKGQMCKQHTRQGNIGLLLFALTIILVARLFSGR